jgi:hypothetical protein
VPVVVVWVHIHQVVADLVAKAVVEQEVIQLQVLMVQSILGAAVEVADPVVDHIRGAREVLVL